MKKAYILLLSCGSEVILVDDHHPRIYDDYICNNCGKYVFIKDIIEVIGKKTIEGVLNGKRRLKKCTDK